MIVIGVDSEFTKSLQKQKKIMTVIIKEDQQEVNLKQHCQNLDLSKI
ncbi:unnamed protein product (macronuclear) [Paramecium tetraurelia]|uniref:Uncharacterized protein n=1 Tax=Paramecium tetraurelia TaxID=5888 RepID=A0BHT4_PARTE|nr:uncharacterized protein GSPATT00029137001 [Paramecium tetraurelia]CAK58101.1 unnamed protein product [Paramecium tetraurelia]|eukprot:XP_001425499.1 hypothetical protein (macronuclear) [Paramecium tetraurelia strain d4-2]